MGIVAIFSAQFDLFSCRLWLGRPVPVSGCAPARDMSISFKNLDLAAVFRVFAQ